MKTALVCGAAGCIGNHMVNRLKEEGYWVRGVDIKYPEYSNTKADHFVKIDLRELRHVEQVISYARCNRDPYMTFARQFDVPFDEIYQFAADMGGAGYVFSGENDADIMHNSATINLNVLNAVHEHNLSHKVNNTKIFYSSSACIYPAENQTNPNNPNCEESSAYPANPDSEYGWEKLFSERLYLSYHRNFNIPVRIARFHNIYGPLGTWRGGKEKAPAAICRKMILANDEIEIWGTGNQTRSFLYIDDCIDGVRKLMEADFVGPVNIGSEEMVTINELVTMAATFENKNPVRVYVKGPVGVNGRNSHNALVTEKIGWAPKTSLRDGLYKTYEWIREQIMDEVEEQ